MRDSKKAVLNKYARAFLSSSSDHQTAAKDLAWAASTLSPYLRTLSNPCLPPDVIFEIVSKILIDKRQTKILNLIRILVANKRISLIKEIALRAAELADEMSGIKKAVLISRFDIEQGQIDGIKEALSLAIGGKIKIEREKSEDVIGGVQIKIGDLLIDGSIKGRLESLRKKVLI